MQCKKTQQVEKIIYLQQVNWPGVKNETVCVTGSLQNLFEESVENILTLMTTPL